jgi:heterodisulfide reductase subunit A
VSAPVILVAGAGNAALEAAREVVVQGGRALLVRSGGARRQCSLRTPSGIEVIEGDLIGVDGALGRFIAKVRSDGEEQVVECSSVIVAPGPEDRPTVAGAVSLDELLASGAPEGTRSAAFIIMKGAPRASFIRAVRAARDLRSRTPRSPVTVFAGEMTAHGTDELEYRLSQSEGVVFVRASKPRVTADPLRVTATDQVTGVEVDISPDLLVIEEPIIADADIVSSSPGGFAVLRGSPSMGAAGTTREGISSPGPEDGRLDAEAVAGARAAATRAMTLYLFPTDRVPQAAVVDRERCAACLTCTRVCPFGAAHPAEEGKASIDGTLCQACGICVGACPGRAISLPSYGSVPESGETLFAGGQR